jgi:hypothetical protein
VLFAVAVLLAALAVSEKALNFYGYTLIIGYTASRLLEFAVVALMFVIALLLRDLRHAAMERRG